MTWLNPVAFVGLLALAVPILVHLFGRRIAKRQRFPSLRLLQLVTSTPTTRSEPSDLLLLLLRCLVIVAAVTALAQPRWSGAGTSGPVRVLVVDTSASMQRLTSDGTTLLQRARSTAMCMIDSSTEALLVESAYPGGSVAGAASWLARRSGLRELVVISDFQAGSLEDGHLAALGADIGARFVRVPFSGSIGATHTVSGVTIEPLPDRTSAQWTVSTDTVAAVAILAAEHQRDDVRRSVIAARSMVPRAPRAHAVTVVFPSAPTRRELLSQAKSLDSAWQGDLMLALARDPVLASVAVPLSIDPSCQTKGTVVARSWYDLPAVTVAGSAHGLLVFACVEPGTLAGTALLSSVDGALNGRESVPELEPNYLPDETLRRWERPGTVTPPRGPEETSPDGRWLWLAALALLGVEELVRRHTPRRDARRLNEVRRERVS